MSGFLNRWSKRKAGLEHDELEVQEKELVKDPLPKEDGRSGQAVPTSNDVSKVVEEVSGSESSTDSSDEKIGEPAMPTLEDTLALTKDSDYSAYVQQGIDPDVQQAAMKKLFSDPHYNIMDGLDIYIEDYNKFEPIPLEMLKLLNQSEMLGLFKTPEQKQSDLQAELDERKGYEERLAKLDEAEAEAEAETKAKAEAEAEENKDVSKQSAELEDSLLLPDENSNGINAANSSELIDSQKIPNNNNS